MIRVLWCAMALLFMSRVAFADIIEVRGRGMTTGKVISQDKEGVSFKNNDGRIERIAQKDILFLDQEAESSSSDKMSFGQKNKTALTKWFYGVKNNIPVWIQSLRDWTDSMTKKFKNTAGKPLNRTMADHKAKQLADAMDDAGKAQAALAKKNTKISAELKRQQEEAKNTANSKGRFAHL